MEKLSKALKGSQPEAPIPHNSRAGFEDLHSGIER